MRRAPTDAVFASILPSQRRTAKQRSIISEFQFRPKKLDRKEFTHLYSAASVHLEEVDRGPGFRYDTLRIEVSGPTQPHLTLIVRSCVADGDILSTLTSCVIGLAWADQNYYW